MDFASWVARTRTPPERVLAIRSLQKEAPRLALGEPFVEVHSRAADRGGFVRRPDLGRRLRADDAARLPHVPCDILFVIADGLSALAAARQAPGVLEAARAALAGWSIGPVVVAHNARVALGDEIGELVGARCVVMMIGERPRKCRHCRNGVTRRTGRP